MMVLSHKYTNIAEEKSIFKPTHSELHYCYSAQELPLSLNLSMLPKEDFYNISDFFKGSAKCLLWHV